MSSPRETLDKLRAKLRSMGEPHYWHVEDTVGSLRRKIAKRAKDPNYKKLRKPRKPRDLTLPTSKKATRAALKALGVKGYSARAETLDSLHAMLIKAHRGKKRAKTKSPRSPRSPRSSKSPRSPRSRKSPRHRAVATVGRHRFEASSRLAAADKAFTYLARWRPHGVVDHTRSAKQERAWLNMAMRADPKHVINGRIGTGVFFIKRYGEAIMVCK